MPRGGKRPGAGAPRGNLNALKTGHSSPRIRELALTLASVPRYRDLLLGMAVRRQADQRRAERIAAQLLLSFVGSRSLPSDQLAAALARLETALRRPSAEKTISRERLFAKK